MDKNQFVRFKAYDNCFRQRQGFHWKELKLIAEEAIQENFGELVSISKETVYRDKRIMQELFPQVDIIEVKQGVKSYFRYSDLDMSIVDRTLTQDEVNKVEQAVALLSEISGVELFSDLENVLMSLRGYKSNLASVEQIKPVVSFQNDYWTNTNYFSEIFKAIREKLVVEITYDSYNKGVGTYEFHPYFLKHYNEMWYVLGYSSSENKYNRDFALDKIRALKFIKKAYKKNENPNCDFDRSYFDDVVGVSKDFISKVVKIKIKVEPDAVRFVNNKPLYQGQAYIEKPEADGNYYTYLKVRPNKELYNRLLMFGHNIEVIEPIDVRLKLSEMIREMNNKYI